MSIDRQTLRLVDERRATITGIVDVEQRRLVAAWARSWDLLVIEMQAAATDLAAAVEAGTLTPGIAGRSERARRAVYIAAAEVDRLSRLAGATVTDAAGQVATVTAQLDPAIVASQFPPAAGSTATVAARLEGRLSGGALDAIVRRTTEAITHDFARLPLSVSDEMSRRLIDGIARGVNPRTAARELVRALEGGFNVGLTRAMTIARTEMLDTYRGVGQQVGQANSDVVAGWTWHAQLDDRTCPSCWAQHGGEHPQTAPGPLDHQNGRCARVPTVKPWRELGFAVAEPPSLIGDAQTTFARLPHASKVKVMGPGRLEALDRGVPWEALTSRRTTPGWRDSYAPTPVGELPAPLADVG